MTNNTASYLFKTNINCSGCVAAVKPHLDNQPGIKHWQVDTANRDKVLSVETADISKDEIIETIQQAGFKIESINP